MPGAIPLAPNQGRVIQQGPVRVLCIADVRGTYLDTMVVEVTELGSWLSPLALKLEL